MVDAEFKIEFSDSFFFEKGDNQSHPGLERRDMILFAWTSVAPCLFE